MNHQPKRLLILDTAQQRHYLRSLRPGQMPGPDHDAREDATLLGGEALCHYLLREDPDALILARGPLPFLAGNKTTVGYISPLTGAPHYSFVGGRGFAQLLNLGLDAMILRGAASAPDHYAVIAGRAPHLTVEWRAAADLPTGQRSAYHWLAAHELGGNPESGSIFTMGDAAYHGYRAANLACDGLYHAGRGGAGWSFARFLAALVLRAAPVSLDEWLGPRADEVRELRNGEIRERLERYGERLSRRTGGTVTKLYATGAGERPTLPARNAQRLGYDLADLGARRVLRASRVGQTGCHWCQLNCRHWHWVNVDYNVDYMDDTNTGRDRYLDDFEPTYALFAMLDLAPEDANFKARLRLLEEVDRRVVVPIEQMGLDIIDAGVGLAALFEGLARGAIPPEDAPPALRSGPYFGNLAAAEAAITALRAGADAPALRALGDGPQALAERYPALSDVVFTGGPGTLGNPGHANALWTFLMPFSRFFSHYAGQIYKISGALTPEMSESEIDELFRRVIAEMLRREQFICLGNALSQCGFTFVIFSEGGEGVVMDESNLLARTLAAYGIAQHRRDLEWFGAAFWAQSLALKMAHSWRPPTTEEFPARVFEALSQALDFEPEALVALMERLIAEWRRQAGEMLMKFGYDQHE